MHGTEKIDTIHHTNSRSIHRSPLNSPFTLWGANEGVYVRSTHVIGTVRPFEVPDSWEGPRLGQHGDFVRGGAR